MKTELNEYILDGWKKTVRTITEEEARDSNDGRLFLPYPYTVPCEENTFQSLFYWDTYFANRGLLTSGYEELAANNIRNFIYLIDTYGYIPNGSRLRYLNRSQPPFFGMMLADYYNATKDKELLADGCRALIKELEFWDTRRKAPNGLNHYSCEADEETYLAALELYERRTGCIRDGDRAYLGKNVYAEAESGWDFCGRFGGRCYEYNAIDLNCLLYFDEVFLAENGYAESFAHKARQRKEKMLSLMRADDGVFYDYCYTDGRLGKLISCASFFPYFVGLIDDTDGIDKLLNSLELGYGLQATVATEENYQWGENNGWACLQLVACEGLCRCGRVEDAIRIAEKYTSLVEKCFAETHHLWEKYNVRLGSNEAIGEYGTPTMLGWSAGVYQELQKLIEK